MRPVSQWPSNLVALLATLWPVAVLAAGFLRSSSNFEHVRGPDGTVIWSVFGTTMTPWVYWVAFLPPGCLLLWRRLSRT